MKQKEAKFRHPGIEPGAARWQRARLPLPQCRTIRCRSQTAHNHTNSHSHRGPGPHSSLHTFAPPKHTHPSTHTPKHTHTHTHTHPSTHTSTHTHDAHAWRSVPHMWRLWYICIGCCEAKEAKIRHPGIEPGAARWQRARLPLPQCRMVVSLAELVTCDTNCNQHSPQCPTHTTMHRGFECVQYVS